MGNGTRFNHTLEERSSLLAQFSKAMELVNGGLRPADVSSEALQAIIGDHRIVVIPKVAQIPMGKVYHVTGNFASAAEALGAGKYTYRHGLAEIPEEIPMIIQPVDCRLRSVPLEAGLSYGNLYQMYPTAAAPIELLAFGAKFLDEQRKERFITVWRNQLGLLYSAFLGGTDDWRRDVNINLEDTRIPRGVKTHSSWRILVRVASGSMTAFGR